MSLRILKMNKEEMSSSPKPTMCRSSCIVFRSYFSPGEPSGPGSGSGPRPLQAAVPALLVPLPLQQRHAGAAHRHRDINLCVGVTPGHAGARPLQDDGRGVDRSAAVLLALLAAAAAAQQAALAQAVGLRDVARVPGRVV